MPSSTTILDVFCRGLLQAGRPVDTQTLLVQAASNLTAPARADVVMDSGVENLNIALNKRLEATIWL